MLKSGLYVALNLVVNSRPLNPEDGWMEFNTSQHNNAAPMTSKITVVHALSLLLLLLLFSKNTTSISPTIVQFPHHLNFEHRNKYFPRNSKSTRFQKGSFFLHRNSKSPPGKLTRVSLTRAWRKTTNKINTITLASKAPWDAFHLRIFFTAQ